MLDVLDLVEAQIKTREAREVFQSVEMRYDIIVEVKVL